MKPSGLQKHIRCKPGDIAPFVLVPGDPGRAERIAQQMDHSELIAKNREYIVYTGKTGGVDLSVCSTGIGGPAASIAFEELANIGARVLIRVGSAGGRQPEIPIGSAIIITSSYRGEGTSNAYLPPEFPAVADIDVTNALVSASEEEKIKTIKGIGFTRDAYYVQNHKLNELLKDMNVVAAEQEASVLFIVSTYRHIKSGAIVATDSNIWLKKQPSLEEKEKLYLEGEKKTIRIALRAVHILAKSKI